MRRNEIDAGSQPIRNLFTNPAFDTTSVATTIRTNYLTNPAMRAVSGTPQVVRSNLITNPGMEASSGNIAVRTNLCTNPGVENSTTLTTIRTNLTSSPRGVSALNPYSSSVTQTPNVTVTGNPEGLTTALRVEYTTQPNPGISLLDVTEPSTTYAMSIWVYHESVMSTTGAQAFAQAGVASSGGTTPEVGKWVRHSWVYTTGAGTSNIGFRVSSNGGTGNGSMLVTGMLIEKSPVVRPFFDGTTTTLNKCTNPSFEVDSTGWASQWFGNGGGAGTTVRSIGTGLGGGSSMRKTWTTANTTNAADVGISTTIPVTPGATYTASIYQRCSIANSLSSYVIWRDSVNAIISTTARPTVATPAMAWVRGSVTEVAPANAAVGQFIFGPYTNAVPLPQGTFIDWDWCLIEEGDKLNPYYDGSAAAPNDFSYAWTATANNSTSIQRANAPAVYSVNTSSTKIWQSPNFSHNGTKSLAVESVGTAFTNGINFSVANLPIGTYTFSAYVHLQTAYGTTGIAAVANHAGGLVRGNNITTVGSWQRTKVTFTTTSVQTVFLYLITDGSTSAAIGSKFYADSFMLEASSDLSPYFDGANPRTNLLSNPSFEVNSTGWGGAGGPPSGAVSRETASISPYSGVAVLKAVCDGTVVNQGAFTSVRPIVKPNRAYTASAWIKADSGKTVRIELGEWDEGANLIGSRTSGGNVVASGEWQRLSVTRWMSSAANSVDIVVRNVNAVAHTFYVDSATLEDGDTLYDYENAVFSYAWTGTANASSSEQRAAAVAGITYVCSVAPYQSSEQIFSGSKSLYLESASGDSFPHAAPTVSGLTIGTTYTLSAWVYVVPGSVAVELQPSGLASIATGKSATSGRWERIYHIFVANSTSHILRVRAAAAGKMQVYIGGMILEQGSIVLPYFDGTIPAQENIASASTVALSGGTVTTGVSYLGTVWSRATAVTGASALNARNTVSLSKLVKYQPYTVSVTVANNGATGVSVNLDWCDNNSVTFTIAPGEIRRMSTTGTGHASKLYDPVYRFADLSVNQSATEEKSILFKDWLIERGSTLNNYYTGTGDYTYAWTGATDGSMSQQKSVAVIGIGASKSGSDPNARFFAYSSTDETGTKVAKFFTPAGTPSSGWRVASINNMDYANIQSGKSYTLYFRYRATGWSTASTSAVVQLSGLDNLNQVMGSDANNRVWLQTPGWQIYRRTFTATMTALASTVLYISLPSAVDAITDSVLEVSDAFLVDNSHSGTYFDGSTISTDPDFTYAWNGAVDASSSKMMGTSVTGISNTITHGHGFSSSAWRSSGAKSLRITGKNTTNSDSFVDINAMLSGGKLRPYTKYTMAGTRYLKAPLTGTLSSSPAFRVNIGGDRTITYKPGYTAVNVAGATRVVANFTTIDAEYPAFIRLQHSGTEGSGDVWWDDVILVEGDYDGRYLDGTKLNAKWDGTAHASASVGYPTTVESLVGMPFLYADAVGYTTLDPANLPETAARSFYTVVDALVDLAPAAVDNIWAYGQYDLSDSPSNRTITLRYQSQVSGYRSILARRTGGSGAQTGNVPSPGRYIVFCGLDSQGLLFSGRGGSNTVSTDSVSIQVPHERFNVVANNSTHSHVATYMYAGTHDQTTRNEIIKLLAQRHNVPLLV